ncbi:MAG: sensor histidine kinase [Prolixibacteraceae bacterium]
MAEEHLINILIVDDRKENLHSLESLLLNENYRFFTSLSGEEALKIAIKEEIHLILLDVQMPEMDGYEVAQLLKMNKKTENIPIIFITAINREDAHAIKGFETGAADYIFKPVVPEILKAKVSVFIELYKKELELAEKNRLLTDKNKELQDTHKKLKETNNKLEQRVEERTVELTDRNRELQRINQVLDNFLHVSAHDLRGPLSNLKMALNIFGKVQDKAKQEQLMEGIDTSLHRIDQTIIGIIEMVEVQKDKKNGAQKVILEKLIDEIKMDYQPQIEKNKATIVSDFSEAPEINFIEPYLESIFRNLISNALKYRSEENNPVIHISSSRKDNQLHLVFKDNGTGIDLNKHGNTLFKAFSRIEKQNTDGKGIGLHLVKNIVEMNGGNIEVESKPGEGTTFKLMLQPYPLTSGR